MASLRIRDWAGFLLAALALRILVAFVFLGDMPLVSDAASYADVARQMLRHFPGNDAYFWPPGTPFCLAAFFAVLGDSLFTARAAAIVASMASLVLVVLLAGRLLTNPRAVRITGWLAALYPASVMMSGQTYSQHFITACLLFFAYCLVCVLAGNRFYWWGLAGLALGVGALVRPSMLALVPVLGIAAVVALIWKKTVLRTRHLIAGTFVGLAVAAVVVLPVARHNYIHDAGLTISINNERNLFLGNNKFTPDYKTSHLAQREFEELPVEAQEYLATFVDKQDRASRNKMIQETKRYVIANPGRTLWRTLNRIRSFWGFDYIMSRQIQLHYELGNESVAVLLMAEAGGYCLIMFCAISGLAVFWRHDKCAMLLMLFIVGYQIPYAIAFSAGTYHFPVVWLLMPFAAMFLSDLLSHPANCIRRLAARKSAWFAHLLFVLIQIEYAWHTIRLTNG